MVINISNMRRKQELEKIQKFKENSKKEMKNSSPFHVKIESAPEYLQMDLMKYSAIMN